ncbi:uncharacterized protein LOC129265866 [Lytechinus pictus]|uniref:uncharacterized protein LOC129265866 n=1 Tax=Lytechinus pictus TaxID=7653 RepID=UPI0030B9C312
MLTNRNIPISADEVSLEGSTVSAGVTIITNDTSKFVIYNLDKPSKNKCCPCPRLFLEYSRTSGRLTGSLQLLWSMAIITLSSVMLILHGAIEAFCVNMSIGVLVFTCGTVGVLSFDMNRIVIGAYMILSLISFFTMAYTMIMGAYFAQLINWTNSCRGIVYIYYPCDPSEIDESQLLTIGVCMIVFACLEALTSYIAFIFCCIGVCSTCCSLHCARCRKRSTRLSEALSNDNNI